MVPGCSPAPLMGDGSVLHRGWGEEAVAPWVGSPAVVVVW